MGQTRETCFESMPCPQCGSQHLIQMIKQSEDVYVDENGDFENIEPRGFVNPIEVACPECDEVIWTKD